MLTSISIPTLATRVGSLPDGTRMRNTMNAQTAATSARNNAQANDGLPSILLVQSRRSTFTRSALSRKDIRVALLAIAGDEVDLVGLSSPAFILDPTCGLAEEVTRFQRWAAAHQFNPNYFCNPNEAMQHIAQRFAAALGLPHLTQAQVELVRNKVAMKMLYQQHGIPCAAFSVVRSSSDVDSFAALHGYPVIVKPVDSDSCINTFRVDSAAEVPCLCDDVQWMVETYIAGREYQICAIVAGGKVLDAYVASNPAPIIEVFTGGMNANITLAPSEQKPIEPVAIMQQLASLVGLDHGYLHGEFFMTDDGRFFMSEIAARLSGCEVPLNHGHAYGFDLLHAIMDTYVGRYPELVYTRDRAVGDLLLPAVAGVVTRLSTTQQLMAYPGVLSCQMNVVIGDCIQPKRSSGFCAGYVQVEGRTSAEVQERMQRILDGFVLDVADTTS